MQRFIVGLPGFMLLLIRKWPEPERNPKQKIDAETLNNSLILTDIINEHQYYLEFFGIVNEQMMQTLIRMGY